MNQWIQHYEEWFSDRIINEQNFFVVYHPYLDNEITIQELNFALRNLKPNKSIDGILNEQLQHLSRPWRKHLNELNNFLKNENLPRKLKTIKLTLIHKKGDRTNQNNYRGIALVNTVTKLLTYIVNNRMKTWVESNNVLPEAQSGFRRHRSCTDNLFVINSFVQSNFLTKKKGLYAIFVDFQKAFDSVPHERLWEKIYHLGISGKITRLLKNMYNEATLQISVKIELSREIEITKEVLQAE